MKLLAPLFLTLLTIAAAQFNPQPPPTPGPGFPMFNRIIIGGGTAGCILAARLSANPSTRVLLLVDGDDNSESEFTQVPFYNEVNIPTDYPFWSDYGWSVEGPGNGRTSQPIPYPKTLGGASMLNAGLISRPPDSDYERLVAMGNTAWSPANILARWNNIENFQGPVTPGHGTNGPIQTHIFQPTDRLNTVLNALQQVTNAPFAPNLDLSLGQAGVGHHLRAIKLENTSNGVEYIRQDSWTTYLKPVLHRPNLVVRTFAKVTKLSRTGLCGANNCVDTVEYYYQGTGFRVFSQPTNGRIILSAGFAGSTKVLLHSGIGPCAELAQLGIPCLRNVPNVGKGIFDHISTSALYLDAAGPDPQWNDPLRKGALVGGYYNGNIWSPVNESEITIASIRRSGLQGILASGVLLNTLSSGEIKLRDIDYLAKPNISFNMLGNQLDGLAILNIFKKIRQMFALANQNLPQLQIAPGVFIPPLVEISPGFNALPPTATDEEIGQYLITRVLAFYHTVGSTRMGNCNQGAVVDQFLNVCGVGGLKIVDNGVMPFPYLGHSTYAGALIIGEQGAHFVLNNL